MVNKTTERKKKRFRRNGDKSNKYSIIIYYYNLTHSKYTNILGKKENKKEKEEEAPKTPHYDATLCTTSSNPFAKNLITNTLPNKVNHKTPSKAAITISKMIKFLLSIPGLLKACIESLAASPCSVFVLNSGTYCISKFVS